MSEITIGEMITRVVEGSSQAFEPSDHATSEERYFRVWQNWDYRPGRLEWLNVPSREEKPRNETRFSVRTPITRLPLPDVRFKGPSRDVVDFYGTGSDVFFISRALFKLIDGFDPGSLEHLEFSVRARDKELPFHAVIPRRVLEAVDPRLTTVVIKDEDYAGSYFRTVQFPVGIVFKNDALQGLASFTDLDAGGWYWSKDLIEAAQAGGIRGLYAQSVISSPARDIARL